MYIKYVTYFCHKYVQEDTSILRVITKQRPVAAGALWYRIGNNLYIWRLIRLKHVSVGCVKYIKIKYYKMKIYEVYACLCVCVCRAVAE